MTAGPWTFTTSGRTAFRNGDINLATDTFSMALFLSTSNLGEDSTTYAGLTNEHANANGYTPGGINIGSLVLAGATITMATPDPPPAWTASGGDLTARFAVIYETGGQVLCYCLLDSTPADVTATDGNDLVPPTVFIQSLAPFAVAVEDAQRPRRRNRKASAIFADIERTVRSLRAPLEAPPPAVEEPLPAPQPAPQIVAVQEAMLQDLFAEAERAGKRLQRLAALRKEADEAMEARQRVAAKIEAARVAWEQELAEEEELLLLA